MKCQRSFTQKSFEIIDLLYDFMCSYQFLLLILSVSMIQYESKLESFNIEKIGLNIFYFLSFSGKTLLARAVAHHTDCTFIRVSGSELVQKFIGEGSRMVRELFVMAREHAPSIIFMDEIDSIGSSRIESGSGGDSEVQRTMLELLNQLDGFEATKNIKVIYQTVMLSLNCFSDILNFVGTQNNSCPNLRCRNN